jgi:16S rRNA (guanine1207-N2)-methyltransferase
MSPRPAAFRPRGPIAGSELLVALVPPLKGRVADLGAGWGYIAARCWPSRRGSTHLDLIEADHAMLEAARATSTIRARVPLGRRHALRSRGPYDAILCNPPFHVGRRADPTWGAPSSRRRRGC